MQKILTACLLLAGFIKLYPLIGVISAQQLAGLYGVNFDNPDTLLLMRHRAVLFGLLGGYILLSAFRPGLRITAILAGMLSALSFLLLYSLGGPYGAGIHKVLVADVIVVLALLCAGGLVWRQRTDARNARR